MSEETTPVEPEDRIYSPDQGKGGLYLRYARAFFLAVFVGGGIGFVGGLFQIILEAWSQPPDFFRNMEYGLPLSIAVTIVGLFFAFFLIRRFAPEASGSGVQEMEGALASLRPVRWQRVLPVKFISGVITLGLGMVMGREGPTIQMGGNIGRMITSLTRTDDHHIVHSLIAAGSGAGLSAAFNSPFAGILFVVEEMRRQFNFTFISFQSVIIACISAVCVLNLMVGTGPSVPMPVYPSPELKSLWIFLLFGACFGAMGVVFNKMLLITLDFFARVESGAYYATIAFFGAVLALLCWYVPDAVGGGYRILGKVFQDNYALSTLFSLFAIRFVMTMLCYGSGAAGGILAPMLALGTLFGMGFGHIAQDMFPNLVSHPGFFTVAGMGALFSSTVRAPMTGIILVIEMTWNYQMILPLMITCISAVVVAEILGGKPIYSQLLERTLKRAGQVAG